jgi:hypothetical protein
MKLIKSNCERVWLFDIKKDESSVKAGLACFLAGCPSSVSFRFKEEEVEVSVPLRAINNGMPIRILNARLFLL